MFRDKNINSIGVLTALINPAASQTDAALVAAVAGKRIVVHQAVTRCGATTTDITFTSKSGGAGTAITPLFPQAVNDGLTLPFSVDGWFRTNVGEGLSVTTGAGSATGVLVSYTLA